MEQLIAQLNAPEKQARLAALSELFKKIKNGEIPPAVPNGGVNNHIHTTYSFSPYSPSAAVWAAYRAGLVTAGIMDHDSVGGMDEFIKAGEIASMPITCGFECRVKCDGLPFASKRINNPDQNGIAYVAVHGIPHSMIFSANAFLAPYREKRNIRNRKMVNNINGLMRFFGVSVDFDADVLPISQNADTGSVTERHILFALGLKLIEKYGKGQALVDFLTQDMKIKLSGKQSAFLLDSESPYYEYDLLGIMKSELVSKIYVDADEECPDISEFVKFAKDIGAISAYAYLGDVGNSVTGDKRAQKFEDEYISELFYQLKRLEFNAVTYMPTRNTPEQLKRIRLMCARDGFFEISGEDINSPRQSFVCEALKTGNFDHLIDATWALIGHEKAATLSLRDSMFSTATEKKYPDITERIRIYKEIGMAK
ncbi:MAG: PHP domain-containing protein [Clostridiales bacterium]|nr:PHP domain-containing protein [Clostridiales bacterium]